MISIHLLIKLFNFKGNSILMISNFGINFVELKDKIGNLKSLLKCWNRFILNARKKKKMNIFKISILIMIIKSHLMIFYLLCKKILD